MRHNWLDQFLYQTRISMHISERDTTKRLATTAMMVGVGIWAGNTRTSLLIGCTIVFFEIIGLALMRLMPRRDFQSMALVSVAFWCVNFLSVMPYLAFSVLLASHSSIAFVVAAYLWLFGIYVHTSNSFSFLPIYNWSLMTPAFGAAFLLFYVSATHPIVEGTTAHWLLAAAMMGIYIVNTIETMEKHNDTQAALAQARTDAITRMHELEHLTRHDKLTGLKNRVAFDEELAEALQNKTRLAGLAIFLIDLDDFKPINDSYSHMAGDAVLVAAANSLMRIAGPDATVARLGGDEFAAVIPNISSDEAALRLGGYIVRALNAPVRFKEKQLQVGASVGIARASPSMNKAADLCAGADQAMYRAKGDLGQKTVLFDRDAFPVRPTLEDRNTLYNAICDKQIRPYYQPKICLKTGRVAGFEALARWEHPTRGMLRPKDFLPMVSDFGLHGDLLMHMARQVLEDIDEIQRNNLDCGQISINVPEVTLATLSGRSELAALIDEFPHLQSHVTFEITEDVFIARAGDMIQRSIAFFRNAGIRVSLDDFGTGFASFQHLRVLEFDELKLDTDFVQGLGVDPAADVLVDGFLAIGQGLGVQVVAEGVETTAQLKQLQQMGCEVVQGHLFGSAMCLTDAVALLQKGKVDLGFLPADAA